MGKTFKTGLKIVGLVLLVLVCLFIGALLKHLAIYEIQAHSRWEEDFHGGVFLDILGFFNFISGIVFAYFYLEYAMPAFDKAFPEKESGEAKTEKQASPN